MLQGDNAMPDGKQPTKLSVPITSPPPQESQVADKTLASAFPMDSNASRFNETVEFQLSYGSTVHRYFSDLAEMIGNDHQGRPLVTVQDTTSSVGTPFMVSLSTAWLRQVHQGNQEGFHEICHQLNVPENTVLAKIGLVDSDNRERKENKASTISNIPVAHSSVSPPLSSVTSSLGSASSSTSTRTVSPNDLGPSLTPHSSASFFSSVGVDTTPINASGKSASFVSSSFVSSNQMGHSDAKNNYLNQAVALLEETYNLLDQAHPPRDVAHADTRKIYLLQLADYQRRKDNLMSADYTALKQLQITLQQQLKQQERAGAAKDFKL